MNFNDFIGQEQLKNQLNTGRIPHALLLLGTEGSGALALALSYAKMILCKNNRDCKIKVKNMQHPDLHFLFPTSTTEKIQNNPKCYKFFSEWQTFVTTYENGSLSDWVNLIKSTNTQQVQIHIEDIKNILKILNLKSYERGFKVIIIWMPENLNRLAANKLMKILEDPPIDTIFLLVGTKKHKILPTILAQTQIIYLQDLSRPGLKKIESEIRNQFNFSAVNSKKLAILSEGNWGFILNQIKNLLTFEKYFISWILNLFLKKNSIKFLIQWIENISKWNKKTQKEFLKYCLHIFRQSILTHYKLDQISCNPFLETEFHWEYFSTFISQNNIHHINSELLYSIKKIEKNAYQKLSFFTLSIRLYNFINII